MATDQQIYTNYLSTLLYAQVFVENLKIANVILTEDPGTTDHANRVKWAWYITTQPDAAASIMRIAVMSNGDIQNGATDDGTVAYVVGVLTNVIADNFVSGG